MTLEEAQELLASTQRIYAAVLESGSSPEFSTFAALRVDAAAALVEEVRNGVDIQVRYGVEHDTPRGIAYDVHDRLWSAYFEQYIQKRMNQDPALRELFSDIYSP